MFTRPKWTGWVVGVAALSVLCVGPPPQVAFAENDSRDEAPPTRTNRPYRGDKDQPRLIRAEQGRRNRDSRPLTQKQIEQRLEILRRLRPDFAERIEDLLEKNPEMANRMLEQAGRRLEHFQRMQENDPQAFELEVQDRTLDHESHKLQRELQQMAVRNDPDRAAQIRDDIRKSVTQHFEVRHKKREHELAKLERRIKELREQLKRRIDKKDALIEKRYQKLTGQTKDSSW